ncbi:short-chain dehydrogenase [Aulographum hederae CBS 113979]|uniref:Short-chain dehydrogenase n=1 Tax=Aulographum hederae CBS 113979 TaxID=1176131 RepID=A0A6G1H7Y2_9PEZI|nr:short-chain dehydrogenase [Aulographum hederae CBS 113979]
MGTTFSQMVPPSPPLTEKNLPNQSGKVFIVTGGYSGIGYHLSAILYNAGAKVYVAGRTESVALKAIEEIKASSPSATGSLAYLPLDLADLSTIKASVEKFESLETKLHVLWNNAGISQPPAGTTTAQGYEAHIGINCLGPLLFTQLLLPSLRASTDPSEPASTRVVWTSSLMVDLSAPTGGFEMNAVQNPPKDPIANYILSKTGNWFLASELGRVVSPYGILSLTQNPGNLKSNLLRHSWWMYYLAFPMLYDSKFGAYTELWAGLSPMLDMAHSGAYLLPWGRVNSEPRMDLIYASRGTSEDGGTGRAAEFYDWCEDQIREFK